MRTFQMMAISPAGRPDPSIAIAASRAGGLGILDLSYTINEQTAIDGIKKLAKYAINDFGIKINGYTSDFLTKPTSDLPEQLKLVLLTYADLKSLEKKIQALHHLGLSVILETTCLDQAQIGEQTGVDGIIAKGCEAGGRVGNETAFILLQRLLKRLTIPVWVQGGIGIHTTASCYAAGAAGVVLDTQLILTRESPLPEPVKSRIAKMDGSETICIGSELGESYRVCSRMGISIVKELQQKEKTLAKDGASQSDIAIWRQAVSGHVGWNDPEHNLFLLGQDVSFASSLARRFVTVAGVLKAIQSAIDSHCRAASKQHLLSEGSELAQSHHTRYPIVQGPMAQISDTPAFIHRVAEEGALPFVALAMMRGPEAEALLQETHDRLKDRPWGVGMLGFISPDLFKEQLKVVMNYHPAFALIAGGRPDQTGELEQKGILTYLHAPSPGLLRMFLENGVRRLSFEGCEAGGHIGPRTSFVLWESLIDVLLEFLLSTRERKDFHVLFAGGIHDALSASMVAVMVAPLVEQGVRVGIQLGSSYLFTEEAVSTNAIVEGYQQEAIKCDQTTLLETGLGHTTRCIDTPYAKVFKQEKRRLSEQGKSADEIKNTLEHMNLGRLRTASKGKSRNPHYDQDHKAPKFVPINRTEQRAQGIYMMGQLAALRDRAFTIRDLHHEIAVKGSQRVKALSETCHKPSPSFKPRKPSDIAIIGMACLLPKAPNLQTYWENILNKVDVITEVPKDRWDWRLYYDTDTNARDKVCSKWGGFLEDIPFDPIRYGIPPKSIPSIEPTQLLTLEAVRSALEDAGYAERPFHRERTSVIFGVSGPGDLGQKYAFRSALPMFFGISSEKIVSHFNGVLPEWTADSFPGILSNVAAGRVANRFDLGGVNYTVDAACASSLAALYLGVGELENHTNDLVIVGGADTLQNPFTYLCFSKTQALSPRGRCSTFDESADGTVLGEGIAVVVLKRLADAERDGDRIYAVIKGIGASSDGRDKSLTTPRLEGQDIALKRSYGKAGFSPSTVGLIEAHGTGTVVGDQVEVQALKKVFNDAQAREQSCAIGSVKSMIGHTKSTSGLASLIKGALALHHKVLPPTNGIKNPSPVARFSESPFYLNTETRPWIHHSTESPRRAGVSAFGFGGTNFHTVLEEYTKDFLSFSTHSVYKQWPSELLVWKGNSRQELLKAIKPLEEAIHQGAEPSLGDLAFTLSRTNEQTILSKGDSLMTLAVVTTSLKDLRQKLVRVRESLTNSEESTIHNLRGIYFSEQPISREGKVAFLFPGQGSQYLNMLCDLAIQFPEVRASFERSDHILKGKLPKPLSTFIFPPPTFSEEQKVSCQRTLAQTNIAQPATGTADLVMFHLLQDFGIMPNMVAGHSYGEYVALCAAGVISEDDLIALSEARGRFIVEAAGSKAGTMAAVNAGAHLVSEGLRNIKGVEIANLNAPEQTVISGARSAVEEAVEHFKTLGIQSLLIPVACAFHSPIVAPAQKRLASFLSGIEIGKPRLKVFSNTTASPFPAEPKAIRQQLVQHLISRVEFIREIEAIYEEGARIFVEVGPGRVLTKLVNQILGDQPHLAVPSNQAERSGLVQLHHLLGQLAACGIPIKMNKLYEGRSLKQLDLKTFGKKANQDNLSPTTFLVNGVRAIPLSEVTSSSSDQTITPMQLTVDDKKVDPVFPPSTSQLLSTDLTSSSLGSESNRSKKGPSATSSLPENGNTQVMAQFQQMMNRFLETQKSVMLTYLKSTSGTARPLARQQQNMIQKTPPSITASQQDFHTPLTRDQYPSTTQESPQEQVGTTASTIPEKYAPPDTKELLSQLLKIVSDRTGYPTEMLNLDMDLEADLGIDSIKRVEILGSFLGRFAPSHQKKIEEGMENLTGTKTLRGIIEWTQELTRSEPKDTYQAFKGDSPEVSIPKDIDLKSAGDETIQRFTLEVDTSSASHYTPLTANGVIVVTDDERGVAKNLINEMKSHGHAVALVRLDSDTEETENGCYKASLTSPEDVSKLIEKIRKRHGPIGGLIHLLPLKSFTPYDAIDFSGWKERLQLEVKSLFYLIKAMEKDLKQAAEKGGSCIVSATGMGGSFGSNSSTKLNNFFPGQGGIPGLLKTVAIEYSDIRVKAIDLNLEEPVSDLANHLLAEINSDDQIVEVGYDGSRRQSLNLVLTPLVNRVENALKIDSSWVILVTGGARGITADVARELARKYKPTLILAGRSPLPSEEESEETAGLVSDRELKATLVAQMKRQGKTFTLAEVALAYSRLCKEREIRSNLAAMREVGARVEYFQVDVRDEHNFGNLIDQIYQSYGKIDGVIHGAGIIKDKFITDKNPDSFDQVFGTKTESAFILSRKLRPESLKFLVLFSSVAGRFGNQGQCDYTAANEVLNKLAIYLNHSWPGRVLSINWGPWAKTGMVSAELQKQFDQRGIELIPGSIGPQKLDQELRYGQKGEVEIIIGGGKGLAKAKEDQPILQTRSLPLISSGDSSLRKSDGTAQLVRTLDPSHDLYLRDHQMDGKPVLPVAVAMELMAEVVAQSWPDLEVTRLRDISVLRGLVFEDGPETIRVVARQLTPSPQNHSGFNVQVEITGLAQAHRPYYRGTVELRDSLHAPPPYNSNLSDLQQFPMTAEEAYCQWLFSGPILQGIQKIEGVCQQGIRAWLTPSSPDSFMSKNSKSSWLIDPVIIDCAFQLVFLWTRMYWDMNSLPHYCKVYTKTDSLSGEKIDCRVNVLSDSRSNIIRSDITFFNTSGHLLGLMEGAESTCSKSLNRLSPQNG